MYKLQATSYKLQATSYKLTVTSYDPAAQRLGVLEAAEHVEDGRIRLALEVERRAPVAAHREGERAIRQLAAPKEARAERGVLEPAASGRCVDLAPQLVVQPRPRPHRAALQPHELGVVEYRAFA